MTAEMLMFLAIYFSPWFVAAGRKHHQRSAIAVLNLLLGWTVIGWIAALVWACTAIRNPPASASA